MSNSEADQQEFRRTDRYMWRAQPSTLQRLKVYCAKHDYPINAVVDDAVNRYLDKMESMTVPKAPPVIKPPRKISNSDK